MRGLYIGLGTFCILISIWILSTFSYSIINGILGSSFGGLGVGFLSYALDGGESK